jgi:hypothetical protein
MNYNNSAGKKFLGKTGKLNVLRKKVIENFSRFYKKLPY